MSNLGKQQEAMIKSADQTEKLVGAISEYIVQLKIQHEDSIKTQKYMFWMNIIMTAATVMMAIASFR